MSEISRPSYELDFSEYRQFCDAYTDTSRRIGLLSQSLAIEAMNDPATITLDIDGRTIPAVVPIQYVEGYDADRARTLAAEDEPDRSVLYWCVPNVPLDSLALQNIADQLMSKHEKFSMYYEYSDNNPTTIDNIAGVETVSGQRFTERPILEPLAEEDYETPSLIMHLFTMELISEFDQGTSIEDMDSQTMVFEGGQIPDDLIDKLWVIYQERFQWLGENHPITMEDTKDEFVEVLRSPAALIAVSFENNEPQCMVYASTAVEDFYWLDNNFLAQSKDEAYQDIYFAGIVARVRSLGGHAQKVLGAIGRALESRGSAFRVIFESTNLSEAYMPKITEDAIGQSNFKIVHHQVADTTRYAVVAN